MGGVCRRRKGGKGMGSGSENVNARALDGHKHLPSLASAHLPPNPALHERLGTNASNHDGEEHKPTCEAVWTRARGKTDWRPT
ncbi:6610_t:CDS:2, partial [Acaulospora colombiana]